MKKKKKVVPKGVLRKLLRYIGRYKILLALTVVCAALTVASTLYLPVLTGNAVDCIVEKGNVNFAALRHVLLLIGATIAVTVVFQWIMNLLNNRMTYRIVKDIRNDAIHKIEKLPLAYLDNQTPGDIVNRMISDADLTGDGLLMGFTQLFTGVLTIGGTIMFMLLLSARITLLVILLTPLSLFVAAFIASKTYHLFLNQSKIRGEQTGLMTEILQNQKTVKAFAYEETAEKRFAEVNDRLSKCSLSALFCSSISNPTTRFVNGLVYAGVGVFGAFSAINGLISVGQLVSFLSYANQYTKPFNEISGVVTEMQNALACAARIFELLETDDEIDDGKASYSVQDCTGKIDIQDVSFSYTLNNPLIEHFNLEVQPGQKIALVGPTGCGKTTFINLLMRFYDVNDGAILFDGMDIRDLSRFALRQKIGMVLQDTWLMEGTVKDNIRFGKPNATDEEVIAAAKKALVHSFILRLPQGYDTVIGDGGISLSEGQKQLLCIARVMLIKPQILILDEATSSIDTRTEIMIQKAFAELTAGKTSFIVAHRLSTIRGADQILVMKDGHILETGTHAVLLHNHGFYEELYNSQFAHK